MMTPDTLSAAAKSFKIVSVEAEYFEDYDPDCGTDKGYRATGKATCLVDGARVELSVSAMAEVEVVGESLAFDDARALEDYLNDECCDTMQEALDEACYDAADRDDYSRDVYAYHGVSIRDFL